MMCYLYSLKVNETLSNSNGHIQTAYDDNSGEDKPMLQVKLNGNDDQGINALINRQLQGKTNRLWSNAPRMNTILVSLAYCPVKSTSFLYIK